MNELFTRQTIVAAAWRFAVFLFDWRTWLKKVKQQPVVDVVFISNMRDEIDRKYFFGDLRPRAGYFHTLRFHIKGVSGRLLFMDSVTEDLLDKDGRRKAKEQFICAAKWANEAGAKVVLLGAATKRLFGRKGEEIKAKFPNILFTNGDNGTALLLIKEVFRAVEKFGLKPGATIAVLGPSGILGEACIYALVKDSRFDVIGIGSDPGRLRVLKDRHKIRAYEKFTEVGKVDMVVACTHQNSLTVEKIEQIRRSNKKLLVIDVAEPSNLTEVEYEKCKQYVVRQDAGNAYSQYLKYVLGSISYNTIRLTKGVTFGCFSESISLAGAIVRSEQIDRDDDFFFVNQNKMDKVEILFQSNEFQIPSPRCFGKPIKSFDLNLSS